MVHRLLEQPQIVDCQIAISVLIASDFATGVYFIQVSINGSTLKQQVCERIKEECLVLNARPSFAQ